MILDFWSSCLLLSACWDHSCLPYWQVNQAFMHAVQLLYYQSCVPHPLNNASRGWGCISVSGTQLSCSCWQYRNNGSRAVECRSVAGLRPHYCIEKKHQVLNPMGTVDCPGHLGTSANASTTTWVFCSQHWVLHQGTPQLFCTVPIIYTHNQWEWLKTPKGNSILAKLQSHGSELVHPETG